MIGYLKGTVLKNNGKTVLIDTGNIGYEVRVTVDVAASVVLEKTIALYTYLHVREDELSLYGFETEEQVSFFKQLLTISGVGPKMGIEILSLPVHRVKQAIVEADVAYLQTIGGVGEKLASRIVLELKKKIKIDFTMEAGPRNEINMDVVEALEKLGYERNRIIALLKRMEDPIQDEQELIKYCLRYL